MLKGPSEMVREIGVIYRVTLSNGLMFRGCLTVGVDTFRPFQIIILSISKCAVAGGRQKKCSRPSTSVLQREYLEWEQEIAAKLKPFPK